jgi:predicted ribosome quality control (RQC) complex YloA/Tae2 family protein
LSLNWREIDQIVAELDLVASHVQEIHQPTHDTLVFELRARSGGLRLLVSLAGRNVRLHRLSSTPPNPQRPPRFASYLRAHVRGGRITDVSQVAGQRIVRIAVERAGEVRVLWLRLWPNAANVIVTDPDGRILETFHRRPARGEVTGGRYDPRAQFADAPSPPALQVRDLPGDGDLNAKVEAHYRGLEEREQKETLRQAMLASLRSRENGILVQQARLQRQLAGLKDPERLRAVGDVLMANLHRIEPGAASCEAEDFARGGEALVIELDPRLSGPKNAQTYYERAAAARRGGERVAEELAALETALGQVARARADIEAEPSLARLRELRREAPRRRPESPLPGLHFHSNSHRIMVGRTAADNDELLRRHVNGNDYWFHMRDWPGAYVFVKAFKGKSVPLEVMLDAANLAIFYSKGRTQGSGDVYYTQVKFLRRARDGKPGLVIPTREKNLFVRLDAARVERVRQQAAG